MAHVKGSAILARLQFVAERYGATGRPRVLAELSPAVRAELEGGVLPHQWVSYDLFIELNVAIDKLFGAGDLALCYEMGRYGAEANLPTLYRIFYRLGSPLFIFRKAARLWEVHYDSGRLVPSQEGSHQIRIKVLDFDHPHRAHCLSVLGWAARSVELSGATLERAEEERCRVRGDGACEFTCAWKPA